MTAIEQISQPIGAAQASPLAGLFGPTAATEGNAAEFATQIATALEGVENAALINVQSTPPILQSGLAALTGTGLVATSNYSIASAPSGTASTDLPPLSGLSLINLSVDRPDFTTNIEGVNAQIAAVLQSNESTLTVEASLNTTVLQANIPGTAPIESGAAAAGDVVGDNAEPQLAATISPDTLAAASDAQEPEASLTAGTPLPALIAPQLVALNEGFEILPFSPNSGIFTAEQLTRLLPIEALEQTLPTASAFAIPATDVAASALNPALPAQATTSPVLTAAQGLQTTNAAVTPEIASIAATPESRLDGTAPQTQQALASGLNTQSLNTQSLNAQGQAPIPQAELASAQNAQAAQAAAPTATTTSEAAVLTDTAAIKAAETAAQTRSDEKIAEGHLVQAEKKEAAALRKATNINQALNAASSPATTAAQNAAAQTAARASGAASLNAGGAARTYNQTDSIAVSSSAAAVATPIPQTADQRDNKTKPSAPFQGAAQPTAAQPITAQPFALNSWTPEQSNRLAEPLLSTDAVAAGLSSLRGDTGFSENLGSLLGGKPSPALGAQVAKQLNLNVTRAVKNGDNEFTLRLSPGDLGSVRVKLTFTEAGRVTAQVQAQRPETLELLQREARGFERAVEAGGHKIEANGLNFSLDTGDGQSAGKALADAVQQDRLQEKTEQQHARDTEGAATEQDHSDLTDLAALEEILSRVSPTSGLDVRV